MNIHIFQIHRQKYDSVLKSCHSIWNESGNVRWKSYDSSSVKLHGIQNAMAIQFLICTLNSKQKAKPSKSDQEIPDLIYLLEGDVLCNARRMVADIDDGDRRDNTLACSYYANNKSVFLLCSLENPSRFVYFVKCFLHLGRMWHIKCRQLVTGACPPTQTHTNCSSCNAWQVWMFKFIDVKISTSFAQRVFARDQIYASPHNMLSSGNFSENCAHNFGRPWTAAYVSGHFILVYKLWKSISLLCSIVTRDRSLDSNTNASGIVLATYIVFAHVYGYFNITM